MRSPDAVEALSALAQESRLTLFRLLVKRGPEGYCAGEICARLGIPAPTLSFHLKTLAQAGLVSSRKQSRFVYYRANFELMSTIVAFLTEHCCSLATDCTANSCVTPKSSRRRKSA